MKKDRQAPPKGMWTFDAAWRVAAILGVVFFVWALWSRQDLLQVGTFAVLTATLVVLIVYARDTNRLAQVTYDRWRRESVLPTTYDMSVEHGSPTGWTRFGLYNPSTLLVRARVWCAFRVDGIAVDDDYPEFNGRATWQLFPQQHTYGGFEIATLLAQRGATIDAMIQARTDANARDQLTTDLEIEFRDEFGERLRLPARRAYFDFRRLTWVPIITVAGEWDD